MTRFASLVLGFLALLLMMALCLLPVAYGFAALIHSPSALDLLLDDAIQNRFARTIALSLAVAGAATVIGLPLGMAWTAAYRHSRALVLFSFLPLVLPPYVYALAWIDTVGAARSVDPTGAASAIPLYSLAGVLLVNTSRFAPLVAAAVWLAARLSDPDAIYASRISRGRFHSIISVFLPARAPIIVSGPIIVFMLALTDYSVPSLMQVDLYPIDIQTRFSANYDVAGAFALALPLVLAGAVVFTATFFPLYRALRSAEHTSGGSFTVELISRRSSTVVIASFLVVAVALPLFVIAWRTASLRAVAEAIRGIGSETMLSLSLATACALGGSLIAVLVTLERRFSVPALFIALVPVAITAPAFGIAAILAWNHPDWRGAVYDSLLILPIAELPRVIVFGLLAVVVSLTLQSPDLDHAAALAGRSRVSRLFSITLPLAVPALLFGAVLMFLIAFAEADVAALIAPPGATPLAVRIAGLLHYGPSDLIHAATLISAAIALAALSLAGLALRKVGALSE